ncbi:MAG TPA: DNA polymerase Y family protein [Steroidobacteraceae bacterium]|nr:DNA polymerase Y family protein [Steroidobacteraceae bacterium]
MKPRALKSATADLFAAAAPPSRRAATPPAAAASPPPPPEQSTARSRSRHLWYAVVFPALGEPQSAPLSLERLCLHAQRFTPWVSIEPPNALLLEIRGSVKLFGSLAALGADIDAVWSGLKLRAQSSTAPSTLAALWLARAGQKAVLEDPGSLAGCLAKLSVACTSWDPGRLHTLRTMGVNRIGELMRLPRAGIARRLGADALLDLDIALMRQAAPRRAFAARERFHERCDFEMEVETVAYLQTALGPLIERCARFLRERQAGVEALELKLDHRTQPITRIRLGLASVTGDPRRLADVSMHKLARLELAAPVRSLELKSGPLRPLSTDSFDVFACLGGAGGRDTAPQLVERLRARLGEQAVYGICPVPEHRPEVAWQRVQSLSAKGTMRVGRQTPPPRIDVQGMPRPIWLLNEPARLRAPDVERLRQSRSLLEGPERIESGWWDGKDVTRDYYIVRQSGGTRLWIFQERRSRRWFVHGVFA